MKQHIHFTLILFLLVLASCEQVNNRDYNTNTNYAITNDISNQQITGFAEDSFGHIWVSTFRGLNKYNAQEYHQYFNSNDSLSIPDNQVRSMLCDSQNRLWIGTVNGICRYTDQDYFKRIPNESNGQYIYQILENQDGRLFLNLAVEVAVYIPEEDRFCAAIPDLADRNSFIVKCFIDGENNLWVVNPYLIRCYDSTTLELKSSYETNEQYVQYAFLRDNGELWLVSSNRLFILDTRLGKFMEKPEAIRRHPKLSSDVVIEYIHPYNSTSLLIYTQDGFFLYNYAEDKVIYQNEVGFPFDPPKFKVTSMFTDSQKNLWIGSLDQGFVTYYDYKERFNNNNYLRTFTENLSVVSLEMDQDNQLWINTSVDGVFVYDMDKEVIRPVETGHLFPEKKYLLTQVRSIFVDDENNIWLSASAKVIRCRYNEKNNKLVEEKTYWLPMVNSEMTQDRNGTIWVASHSDGIYALRKGAEQFEEIKLYSPSFTFTNTLMTLSTGEILVGSYPYNPQLINPDTWEVTEIDVYPHIKSSTMFIPVCFYEDSQRNIWIGTITNGILRYSPKTKEIENIEGAACTDVSAIIEDVQGNIWVSTLYGLSKYNRTTNKFTNYFKADGIGGNQFNERATCRLDNGTIIFGGTHGLTFFDPIDVTFKRDIPLLFEDLKIHNQLIRPFQSNCIDKSLTYNPLIRLQHNQNSFTISFTALDYSEYERVHYHYMMEGFDKYWIDARNNREVYYSNLPAGKYTFKVRITNNDKSIVEAENAITISVKPAPWATWWAYTLYSLVVLAIGLVILRLYNRNRLHKLRVVQAELEKEQEQRLNKMNMSFFANVSHEFRTPLTMISGPVTQLCNNTAITGEPKQLLYIVQRSVNRMLKLVNQLMDFNKLENDTLRLKVRRTDIISELKRLIEVFAVSAANKGIVLKTYGLEDSFLTWLDTDKIEKITSNLITNALKFTPAGGKIEIAFDVISHNEAVSLFPLTAKDVSMEYVKVSVSDSGLGIPEEKLEKIFERYYQLNEQSQGTYNWGTGIGLYYARQLVGLHHGYIKATNNPREKGARFVYILPIGDNAYANEEKDNELKNQEEAFPLQIEEQYSLQDKDTGKDRPSILVVDDDTEVVHYLKSLLVQHYNITCRFDVENAYKALKEEAHDLVLSDVVMPGASGFDLCRMIKEDIQLCHIPVVLITAKATVEDQVAGLDTGADAYVTKPFDPNYLLALIKSQLSNREKARKLLGQATKTEKIADNVLSPQDNTFMTGLYELMENELSNPELNITRMTEVLKISRTKFYYKVKGLTGENPNVFFKTYKLNRAAELLGEGKYNISEVADMTGFSTLSHFSASFKKQFGVSPSEYN
ncbi:hybrid sensor histidine kinase/response regulator transcription factor [Bacteroides sp. 519]|uniref:hybrid sensor histidine kinase/response regulator transcription factor n=1 Tax=Bacteroides sp. 519 TaxID=2302937 RepID=UPI0013D6C5C7|nr:hybrid sensor histidine kinase/response regulator transcription factor [Bacteroides sp. 519]NDV59395.1 hybrid sensor histidine kinase/response regulator [Bacteroides sp. 519]